MLICGILYAWPSPVLPKLLKAQDSPLEKPITTEESDLISAIFYVGAFLGPLCFIHMVNKFGRKRALTFLCVIPPVSYGILVYAKTVTFYIICRTLVGVYVGAAYSIQPVYLAEVLADEEREFLMSFSSLFSLTGVFFSTSVGPFMKINNFNGVVALVSALSLFLVAFICPQSFHDGMKTMSKVQLKELLEQLRVREMDEEIQAIERRVVDEHEDSTCSNFMSKQNFKFFLLASIPLVLQSSCGMALLVTTSQLVFMETNISIPSHYCSIILQFLSFPSALLAPTLLKKKIISPISLFLICIMCVGICDLIMALYFLFGKPVNSISWIPLFVLICFVTFYICGVDPIPWMILGNTYPPNLSAVGTAISTSIHELSMFPSMFLFHKIDLSYTFLFAATVCFFGFVYFKMIVAESASKIFKVSTRNRRNSIS